MKRNEVFKNQSKLYLMNKQLKFIKNFSLHTQQSKFCYKNNFKMLSEKVYI